MSQYYQEQYYGQPAMDPTQVPPKTSGMAITSLVLSLIGIIPICGILTAPIGVLLGLIAFVLISTNKSLKGRGLAIAAILLGVIFTVAQIAGGVYFYNTFLRDIMEGPHRPLTAASSGDIAGFKSHFVGDGATASDADAQAFITELEARYGKFLTTSLDQASPPPQAQTGQPRFVTPYLFLFENKSRTGSATYEMVDQMTGAFIQKWSSITVHDPDLGDLTYPPMQDGTHEIMESTEDESAAPSP